MRRWTLWVILALLVGVLFSRVMAQGAALTIFMTSLRNDMELLAEEVSGASRPAGWTGNSDVNSQSIVADLWFDNELLADEIFSAGQRPVGWTGATSTNPVLVMRNVRHDLELAADEVFGQDIRPDGWVGAAGFHRCSRTVMNLLYVLETRYNITPRTPDDTPLYCQAILIELESVLTPIAFEAVNPDTIPALVLAVRGDLERLADERLGLNNRPDGWTYNKDVNSPELAQNNFDDMERLADQVLGPAQRPPGYVAAITGDPAATYRNLRFNLELLADATMGQGIRPNGWQGTNPLERCDFLTQSLVSILQAQFAFELDPAIQAAPDFCAALSVSANNVAENPPPPETLEVIQQREDEKYLGEAQFAFAYLDVAATQYMGMVPGGTKFRAWYRNFSGSSMMFVSGEDFAVFVDRRWTTMSQELFDTLPTLEGVRPLTFCDARWCNGPSPTPTPTGEILIEILMGATPVATLAPGETTRDGKQLISWNQIRVNYVLQKPETKTAQVTLELCQEIAQITCEPATSIFNNSTGVALPVVSQLNGLNVYELAYGYTSNLLIESTTMFSTDIWLNDPTLTGP